MRADVTHSDWKEAQATLDGLNIVKWSTDTTTLVRNEVRTVHLAVQGDRCCYCRVDLKGAHGLSVDPEHILPEHAFGQFNDKMLNISVACKRCNMTVKNKSTKHIRSIAIAQQDPWSSHTYLIIHPNLDIFEEHIHPLFLHTVSFDLVWYKAVRGSSKGPETIRQLKLRQLQRNTINSAQGRNISKRARTSLSALLDRFTILWNF